MKQNHIKFIGSVLGAVYCFYYLSTIDSSHFIDTVNLVMHEAGHVLFMFFGTFLTIAGGSLLQLIMPTLFVGYFYRTGQISSAGFVCYWLGINFFSVARYAADARDMKLELLGGDTVGHDWHNMLQMTGLLNFTYIIAGIIYCLGILVVLYGLYLSYTDMIEADRLSR